MTQKKRTWEDWLAAEREMLARIKNGPGAGVSRPDQVLGKTGMEMMEAMLRGELPYPPIMKTLDFHLIEVSQGRAVFQGKPGPAHLNPMGTIHGGWYATMLVVLSACRTGLGEVSGDGVVGLARAFLYAGTPSVVATLWGCGGRTGRLLMSKLYQSLRIQTDKARALRRAQVDLLKQLRAGRLSVATSSGSMILREHPVLWSGFILVGLP